VSPRTDDGIAAAGAAADRLSSAAAAAASGAPSAKVQAAAQEFEAYMLKLMLGELRKAHFGGDGLFKDASSDSTRAMLDDALAGRAAEAGSFGLARQLLEQWEKQA
jgi:Rod binding domain-containing protein